MNSIRFKGTCRLGVKIAHSTGTSLVTFRAKESDRSYYTRLSSHKSHLSDQRPAIQTSSTSIPAQRISKSSTPKIIQDLALASTMKERVLMQCPSNFCCQLMKPKTNYTNWHCGQFSEVASTTVQVVHRQERHRSR